MQIWRFSEKEQNKMVIKCSVFLCKEKFTKGGSVTFHKFPKNQERRRLWEKNIPCENFKAKDHTYICSKHFTEDCFDVNKLGGTWLRNDAIPTIFNYPFIQSKTPIRIKQEERDLDEIDTLQVNSPPTFKRMKYIGDFTEEDMESPIMAKILLSIANKEILRKRNIIKHLQQRERRLKKKLERFQEIINDLKQNFYVSEHAKSALEVELMVGQENF